MSDPGSLAGSSELVENVAAALRADSADLDSYHKVLSSTIGDLLPASMVEVDYERSLGDRMAGRSGRATAIKLHLGDSTMELVSRHGSLVATIAQEVRGVTISRREVPVAEWVRQLAVYLAAVAADSAQARDALSKLLGG
ncbi:MAG: hypothetical protein ACYCSF_06845 [Acidimicrobiales bacterium]